MNRTYESALKLLRSRRRGARPAAPAAAAAKESITAALRSNDPDRDIQPASGSISITPGLRGVPSLVGMREWLRQLGHSDSDVNNLNVIHIAGTKGKGSTCAFIRSFLQAHGLRTGFPTKIGLYTSPDTRCIRERIQINDQWITEADFTKYFFEVWDRLNLAPFPAAAAAVDPAPSSISSAVHGLQEDKLKSAVDAPNTGPRYLQLLALVAFHTFIREKTSATICETHHGGEFDATNLFSHPIVTGITSIGLDHIAQLGPTVENIAWHKSGIFKHGSSPAFSTLQQYLGAEKVIRERAREKGVEIRFVDIDPVFGQIDGCARREEEEEVVVQNDDVEIKLELSERGARVLQTSVQKVNCSVALSIARAFLQRKVPVVSARAVHGASGSELGLEPEVNIDQPDIADQQQGYDQNLTMEDIANGIENFTWPGRFETIIEGNNQWYLDGAHNELSIVHAVEWFKRCISERSRDPPRPQILIFTHNSSERDCIELLNCLAKSLKTHNILPKYVIFTTYQERQDGTVRLDKSLQPPATPFSLLHPTFVKIWKEDVDPSAVILTEESIEEALNSAKRIGLGWDGRIEMGTDGGMGGAEIGLEGSGGNSIAGRNLGMQTLVTGSLHLVGGALDFLRPL